MRAFRGRSPEYMRLPLREQTWKQRALFAANMAIGIPVFLMIMFGFLTIAVAQLWAGQYLYGAVSVLYQLLMWVIVGMLLQM